MNDEHEQRALSLLETLYDLGRADIPATVSTLGEWLDTDEALITDLLARLESQHLVDAARCRLTMQGLVVAATHAGSGKLAKHAA
ncbi:MAG: hypothetical protein WBG86_07435 [Polyangiales bacterium]